MEKFELINTIEKVELKVERLYTVADTLYDRYFGAQKLNGIWLEETNKYHAALLNVVLDYASEIKKTLEEALEGFYEDNKKAAQRTTTETAQGKTPA